MAVIMVDYENVGAAHGMHGVEYLTKRDTLYIFYSQCCAKIRADDLYAIRESGCQFYAYKLLNVGKNALDFYIATQVGACFEKNRGVNIAIISNDKGFSAVADFCKVKEEFREGCVVTASNIATGLMNLNDPNDKKRRAALAYKAKMLDLGEEYVKFSQQNEFRMKLRAAFAGTCYEGLTEQIMELVQGDTPESLRALYMDALRRFGRTEGRAIYHILKQIV